MLQKNKFTLWEESLGSPKFIVAPMVDQSELAWRLLSRKYEAQLCYTPMLHASVFVKDARYRKDNLITCPEDRPLIVQFCANDPNTFVEACKLAAEHCDAIDLNLGCPQAIAKRGHYGAFLQEQWDLLHEMVSRASKEVDVPITCKIRVFPEISRTVQYAQMLENAGCQILTVHGRTRDQKGPLTGIASWEHIKAVKSSVNIPVFANGNIQYLSDVHRCLEETKVNGVMSAEGNLHNPALFSGQNPTVWSMALEYLDIVKRHPCPMSYVRGHLFKLCHHCLVLEENKEIRHQIAVANVLEEFESGVVNLKNKYEKMNNEDASKDFADKHNLPFAPWICQPYVRPQPSSKVQDGKVESTKTLTLPEKRSNSENGLSRNKLKKLQKYPNKHFGDRKYVFIVCKLCANPKGSKCSYDLCKSCCKHKTFSEVLDCAGHKFTFLSKSKANDHLSDNSTPKFSNVSVAITNVCDN